MYIFLSRFRHVAAAASAAACSCSLAHCKATSAEKKSSTSLPKSMPELILQLQLRQRNVFVTGRVDDEMARQVIALLMFLEHEAPETPINMHINSYGGAVQAGLAIHDAMQSISSPVHTRCLGHCESIAAVLLAAGERGERSCMPNARVMIHQPVRGGGSAHNAKQLSIAAASIEKTRGKLATMLAEYSGRPISEIEALFEYDHVCDAQEARQLGLIDKVAQPGDLVHVPPPPPTSSDGTEGATSAPIDIEAAAAAAPPAASEGASVAGANAAPSPAPSVNGSGTAAAASHS